MEITEFTHLLATFRKTAWRLEVSDTYGVEAERQAVADFIATGKIAPSDDADEWYATCRAARDRGAVIGRVRLVGHPVTDYTRWELAVYAGNVAAGEDVRIMDRTRLDSSWDSAPDVWVFDDSRAVEMLYDAAGAWMGCREVSAAPFANLRRTITPLAVPLGEYAVPEVPRQRHTEPEPITLPDALATAV